MEQEIFTELLKSARERTAILQAQTADATETPVLLPEALEELRAGMEELQVVEEEMLQQNEALLRAQESTARQEQRYRELFDFAPTAFLVTDHQGLVRVANREAATLFGVGVRALRGKPLATYVAPESRSLFRQNLGLAGALTDETEPLQMTFTLTPRRIEPFAVEARVTHTQGAAAGESLLLWVVVDITARVEAERTKLALAQEQAAREQFQMLETLMATAPTGFAFADPHGQVRQANAALPSMLGLSMEGLVGSSLADILGETIWQTFRPLFRQVAQGENVADAEFSYFLPDKRRRHFQVAHYPVHAGAEILGVGLVVTDITRRKDEEALLQGAYEREHRIAETLQRSMLRSVPEDTFSGLSVATFYEAALEEAQVGGDFFDAFTLDDGLIAFVVGDVSGKGLGAAACTSEIKYTLRAFLRADFDPGKALARLNDFMCEARRQGDWSETVFATLSLCVIDPTTGAAEIALAGAEPCLILQPSGNIETVEPQGMLLGIEPERDYPKSRITLEIGDTLLMVTDGLTEARQGRRFLELDGLSALAQQEKSAPNARALGEAILRGVRQFVAGPDGSGALHDDACMLVVRRSES